MKARSLVLPAAALALGVTLAARVESQPAPAVAVTWRPVSQSPRAPGPLDARQTAWQTACAPADGALLEVAARTAQEQARGGALIKSDELVFHLRAAGNPHPWPRAWSVAGSNLAVDDTARRLRGWVAPWNTLGVRRCGVARAVAADGTEVVAAVAVDALADLAPLPTTARVGQWITLEGTMLVPASEAKVVLLGPRGAPKTITASLAGDKLRSSFAVDQPGEWMVQVLATVSTGPRPVLDAAIFAGVTPPAQFVASPAPGEGAGRGAKDDDEGMFRMINASRASEQLPALTRDAALDKLARVHSEQMIKVGMVGHDVGTGDPAARLRAAGIRAHVTGENVATAATLENAHRALWASPSHRGNLLLGQFTRVGVAVVRSADGMVWVTEIFSG